MNSIKDILNNIEMGPLHEQEDIDDLINQLELNQLNLLVKKEFIKELKTKKAPKDVKLWAYSKVGSNIDKSISLLLDITFITNINKFPSSKEEYFEDIATIIAGGSWIDAAETFIEEQLQKLHLADNFTLNKDFNLIVNKYLRGITNENNTL